MRSYEFNRLLVCLDLSTADEILIQSCSLLVKRLEIDKVYFFHVVKTLELPKEIIEKYPDLVAPVDESVKRLISDNVEKHFDVDNCQYDIDVAEGNRMDQILRWTKVKEIDLVILGRKRNEMGPLPEKLIKICHSSLLIIPENVILNPRRILVPMDLSEYSKMAYEHAKELSDKVGAELLCEHSYRVPSGYHTTGRSFEEFAEIMRNHARKDFGKFFRKMNVAKDDHKCILILDEHHAPAKLTLKTAQDENVDLIVMGSKGRTDLASILLGSVAMKLIRRCNEFPLLVVKDKKENLGFLDALLKI